MLLPVRQEQGRYVGSRLPDVRNYHVGRIGTPPTEGNGLEGINFHEKLPKWQQIGRKLNFWPGTKQKVKGYGW